MGNSWQSRLAAKQNHLAQKLTDNMLVLGGAFTDVILMRQNFDKFGDTITLDALDMDVINIAFPDMKDIPLRRFMGNNNLGMPDNMSADAQEEENKPIQCVVPAQFKLDQGSIVVRFFDHVQGANPNLPTSTLPWVLPLQVKDIKGTFGYRSMIYQKVDLGYYDNEIPQQVQDWIMQMATRRGLLGW